MNDDDRAVIVALGADLETKASDLAARFGVSVATIVRLWRKAGLDRPKERLGHFNGMFGRGHTPEAVEKIREATRKQFAKPENRKRASDATIAHLLVNGTVKVSSIERRVGEVLARLGIAAKPQHGLRDAKGSRYVACIDFYLPDRGIALEVNGTYWHADPRFYDPTRLNATQKRTQERYLRKREQLKAAGLQLVEVWEADIDHNVEEAVLVALKRAS